LDSYVIEDFQKVLLVVSMVFMNVVLNSHGNGPGLFARTCERMINCTYTIIFTTYPIPPWFVSITYFKQVWM